MSNIQCPGGQGKDWFKVGGIPKAVSDIRQRYGVYLNARVIPILYEESNIPLEKARIIYKPDMYNILKKTEEDTLEVLK